MLQVDAGAKSCRALRIGTASDLMIETAFAIGKPVRCPTPYPGVIQPPPGGAGQNRTHEDFIQTDAQINPGKPGGAALNIHGELIGINTAVHLADRASALAIPIDRARTIVNEIQQFGCVHGWLSASVPPPSGNRRRPVGVVVAEVELTAPPPSRRIGRRRHHPRRRRAHPVRRAVLGSAAGPWPAMSCTCACSARRWLFAAPLDLREVSQRARRRLGLEVGDANGRAAPGAAGRPGSVADRIGFFNRRCGTADRRSRRTQPQRLLVAPWRDPPGSDTRSCWWCAASTATT